LKELTERWTVADNKKDKPDIGLALVYRKLPALLITNSSNMTANAPKYSVILWNLDSDRRDPLPIPVQVALGDYVVPRASWGPNNILDTDLVSRYVRKAIDYLGIFAFNVRTALRFGTIGFSYELGKLGGMRKFRILGTSIIMRCSSYCPSSRRILRKQHQTYPSNPEF
jgi:hypothetical protein